MDPTRLFSIRLEVDNRYFVFNEQVLQIFSRNTANNNLHTVTLPPNSINRINNGGNVDFIDICFRAIAADPDGPGPFGTIFNDPSTAAPQQYFCDIPGNSQIIIRFKDLHFASGIDTYLHNCLFAPLNFITNVRMDRLGESEVDLDWDRSVGANSCSSNVATNSVNAGTINGNHVGGTGIFAGYSISMADNPDINVNNLNTAIPEFVDITHTYTNTSGNTPWQLCGPLRGGNNNANTVAPGYNLLCGSGDELIYAHIEIPCGYSVVGNSFTCSYTIEDVFPPIPVSTTNTITVNATRQGSTDCGFYDVLLFTVPCGPNILNRIVNIQLTYQVDLTSCPSVMPCSLAICPASNINQANGGISTFPVEFRSQLGGAVPGDPGQRYFTMACSNTQLLAHCAGGCSPAYVGTSSFNLERDTYGWTSEAAFIANPGTPNFVMPAGDPNEYLSRHRVYLNDQLNVNATGNLLQDSPPFTNITHANFTIEYPSPLGANNNFLEFDYFDMTIHNVVTGTTETYQIDINSLPQGFAVIPNLLSGAYPGFTNAGITIQMDLSGMMDASNTLHNYIQPFNSGNELEINLSNGIYHVGCSLFASTNPTRF
jgi:hypothetical protein